MQRVAISFTFHAGGRAAIRQHASCRCWWWPCSH